MIKIYRVLKNFFFNLGILKVLSYCISNVSDGGEDGEAEWNMYKNNVYNFY